MHVVVASQNPVKTAAVKNGFSRVFPNIELNITGVKVTSNVANQPMSSLEALLGALNRANNAAQADNSGDYYVGLEGGVEDRDGAMYSFAWIAVRDKNGKIGKGKTGEFILPPKIRELIVNGTELGDADDMVFGKKNSKRENGAVGILTHDVIDRTALYTPAVVFALIPFTNHTLY